MNHIRSKIRVHTKTVHIHNNLRQKRKITSFPQQKTAYDNNDASVATQAFDENIPFIEIGLNQ